VRLGRIGDPAWNRHHCSGSELGGPYRPQLTTPVKGEEVVAGGDVDRSSRGEDHLEDPVGWSFEPARDLVVADFERLRVERDRLAPQPLPNDLLDRPGSQRPKLVENHDAFARRKAR